MATKPLRIPITNIYDGNDYSAKIYIGSQKTPANLILDTGSSTLAVKPSLYNGSKDSNLKPTSLAQLVQYGTGGWAGPVVNTNLGIGLPGSDISLPSAPVAIADIQQRGNFTGVDGILGLAYNSLNEAYDFKTYFKKYNINPAATYPWSFPSHSFKKFLVQFNSLVKKENLPPTTIDAYFSALEEQGIVANKFAFYTLRSWVNMGNPSLDKDPLNNGFFILGGGEEQDDLFTGNFSSLKVLHDIYYNTNLKAVQVDGASALPAQALPSNLVPYYVTNSIIDSGTSYLALSKDVFDGIVNSLQKLNPKFVQCIQEALQKGNIATADLNLGTWPKINFIFTGEAGDVTLSVTPQTYWQTNYPTPGKAMLQMGGDGAQSIFGLPLMNNYYTVFDRSVNPNVVKFAAIKV